MQLILISGLSGSGKSIALNVLEDAGYFCVDNLPSALLLPLVAQLRDEGSHRIAVAMDMRAGAGIASLPQQMIDLRGQSVDVRFIFLDARDDVLIQRFSETRRRHPLGDATTTLAEAIAREREGLETLAALGHHIDTSHLRPNILRAFVRDFVTSGSDPNGVAVRETQLTLLFESFGFKYGLPLDADLVFDVRCLPNPHYDPQLRPLDGRDTPVIEFLAAQPEVRRMHDDIRRFVNDWLPSYLNDSRAYLTVAIGCTGGQHRSVYLAESLAHDFQTAARVLVRHRAMSPK
jgi:UPF0042 nucleotide-binding protein